MCESDALSFRSCTADLSASLKKTKVKVYEVYEEMMNQSFAILHINTEPVLQTPITIH